MPGIDYTLGMKTAGFSGAAKGAISTIQGLGGGLSRVLGPLAAMAGAFIGVRASLSGLQNAFNLGGALSDLSSRTGASVKDLVILQQAFRDNGISADSVGAHINRMQKALAGVSEDGEDTSKVFGKLGIDMAALRKMGAAAQLDTIGKAIRGISDPAQRAAASMGIFGRSGGELLTLFADAGALEGAGKTLGNQADILQRNSATFDRISDILEASGQKLSGFFVGVADKVAPVLLPLLESFNKLDLSGFGQKVGEAFAFIGSAFSSGELSGMVGDALTIGFMDSVNFLWKGLRGALAAAGQMIVENFRNAIMWLQVLTTADFWKGMGNALTGIFLDAVGFLQKGLAEALEVARPLAELFGQGDSITSGQNTLRDSAKYLSDEANAKYRDSADPLSRVAEKIEQRYTTAAANITKRFNDGFSKTGNIMDPTGAQASLNNAAERVRQAIAAAAIKPTATGSVESPAESMAIKAAKNGSSRGATADRLAQIGLYVGGASRGMAEKAAAQTAKWTEQSAKHLAKLVSRPLSAAGAAF